MESSQPAKSPKTPPAAGTRTRRSSPALTALAGVGCDVAQGYHLARPMPVDVFDTWAAVFATRVPGPASGRPTAPTQPAS